MEDAIIGESPVVSYWKQTFIASDNRIPALGDDTTWYTFAIPETGFVRVSAKLHFRRNFQPLMDNKDWQDADIIMVQTELSVDLQPMQTVLLPFVNK